MSPERAASDLLVELVRVPSPSGEEERVARALESWARERRLDVLRDDAALRLVVEGEEPGPTLLLASHLDTVPPGEGWSVDPYAGVVSEGVLRGRGAVDAKASVAAMCAAAAALAREGGPAKGRVVVLATYSEETRDTTMPLALERLGALPEHALVGEPTRLEPCIAQRGLMIAEIHWSGDQLHAGWAADQDTRPENVVTKAARDLLRLSTHHFARRHPLLGEVVATPTQLQAGVARNMTPPRCTALLDVRTTPAYEHDEIAAELSRVVEGEVRVLSDRLKPAHTPPGSRLLAAIRRVRPEGEPFASPTSSDWVWLRDCDALKLGPGDSRLSHRADEAVELAEVEAAAMLYAAIARELLS